MENKEKDCDLCMGKMLYYLSGKDYLYKTSNKNYQLYKCDKCGLEKILPTPSNKEIRTFYPITYYSYNVKDLDQKQKSIFLKIREKIVERYFSHTVDRNIYYYLSFFSEFLLSGVPTEYMGSNRFLDIGCGDGYNLNLLSQYGWKTTGFEIGKKAKKKNIYFDSSFNKVNFDNKKFDYIRIWHVLEHVPKAEKLIKKVASLISEDAEVVIGLPNTKSIYSLVFNKYWFGRDLPRHLYGYNVNNLTLLLAKQGLMIKKVKYLGVGGFCGSIQNLLNNKFDKRLDFINNIFLVLLFLPLDMILNFLKLGDIFAVTAVKNNAVKN
jgi:2-polyprenyl-3-methyl-5-hydroxy-6-metoxy-1,4-benzoquinol methylase